MYKYKRFTTDTNMMKTKGTVQGTLVIYHFRMDLLMTRKCNLFEFDRFRSRSLGKNFRENESNDHTLLIINTFLDLLAI